MPAKLNSDWPHESEAPLEPQRFRDLLFSPLRECGFENPQFDDPKQIVTATRHAEIGPPLGGRITTQLTLKWEAAAGSAGRTRWRCKVTDLATGGATNRNDVALRQVVAVVLQAIAGDIGDPPSLPELPHHPVIGPDDDPPEVPFTGTLRDYSGFAASGDVQDLTRGVFPLGRWTFAPPGRPKSATNFSRRRTLRGVRASSAARSFARRKTREKPSCSSAGRKPPGKRPSSTTSSSST